MRIICMFNKQVTLCFLLVIFLSIIILLLLDIILIGAFFFYFTIVIILFYSIFLKPLLIAFHSAIACQHVVARDGTPCSLRDRCRMCRSHHTLSNFTLGYVCMCVCVAASVFECLFAFLCFVCSCESVCFLRFVNY